MVGNRLEAKGGAETINFDAKVKLEEKERRSQTIILGFNLILTTKPNIVKFEVEGTATLTGKDADISKMLEVDPETKVPYVFQRIYQQAFTAMYLLSTILNAPPPPQDLLFGGRSEASAEGINVDVEVAPEAVSVQAEVTSGEGNEAKVSRKS